MLPDRVSQLLTAYIDGELNAPQRQAVERLLGESAEARKLFEEMRHDADALRQLPRRKLDGDFAQRVLGGIAERRLQPTASQPRSADAEIWDGLGAGQGRGVRPSERLVYPMWVGVAAAAAILVVAILTSFFYFAGDRHPNKESVPVAKTEERSRKNGKDIQSTGKQSANPPSDAPRDQEVAKSPATDDDKSPTDSDGNKKSLETGNRPAREAIADNDVAVDATPTPRLEVFKKLDEVKLALALHLRDLDQSPQQERLRERLKEDSSFHLDVVCAETARGLERLETAFKSQGIKLLIDKAAQARWKKGLKTNYALYSEDVTVEELSKVLQELGRDEKKAEAKRRFDQVIIHHLTPSNQKELCKLLGVDPKTLPAQAKAPLGVDIRKPLSESTAEQLADSLAGKGTPRPKPGEAVDFKKPQRQALVLSYNPLRVNPGSSKEIKSFLASRPDRRAGTLQILLVLRGN